jgi:phage baseplate assembly protein W
MIRYKGFSTVGQTKRFKLVDIELIRRDLMNHFSIRKGEKLMNADFGTIIWGVIFDQMTPDLINVITEDVEAVVNYDPRVSVQDVTITEYEHGIQLEIDLLEKQTNELASMLFTFDGTTNTVSAV